MVNQQTKFLVSNLIKQLDMEKCIQNSFRNYHTEGLFYINLFRREDLTIKLYFLIPELIKPNSTGLLVMPHNHAYNFSTEVLFGSIKNALFEEVKGNFWSKYHYTSKNKPEERFSKPVVTGLLPTVSKLYKPGESCFLTTNEIHSLEFNGEFTCLLLHQYEDRLTTTNFYTPDLGIPEFTNAYQKFSSYEISAFLDILKRKLEL